MTPRLHPYSLPLVRPWVAASATITVRSGVLVAITNDGLTGWGDCAPLPSSADPGRVFRQLETFAGRLSGISLDEALSIAALAGCAEVRWALETALMDLKARREGIPLVRVLGGDAVSIPVNAALGALDEGCAARAEAALARGFTIGKVKVGLAPVEDELRRLRQLPPLRLRLDANRAWSAAEAQRFLGAITHLPIDSVEEPLAEPDVGSLARLQAGLPYAIAIDESLPELGLEALLDAGSMRRLVLKPARLGGMALTRRVAGKARAAGVDTVLTSVVESCIGVTATAHLAAAIAPELPHGLATLDWLAEDVAPPPRIEGGRLFLPPGSGLGCQPDQG